MKATTPKLKVGVVLTPRFTATAFSGFVDTLRLAADEGDRSRPIACAWSVLGRRGEPIVASCGAAITPWDDLDEPERFDYIVVVGGLMHGGQRVPERLGDFLARAVAAKRPLVGLCTGSFVLARFGLLDGYVTCVSWFHREDFQAEFPQLKVVSNRLYVVDRDRLTCAGGTSVVHLAAYLVGLHCGEAEAEKSLRIMIEDHPLPGSTPQPEHVVSRAAHDPLVKRAMLLIEQNLAQPNDLGGLAEFTGVSLRQLQRRFVSDIGLTAKEYRSRLRLSRAKWLIEHTAMSLTDIGFECGFADGAHLSRAFRQFFSMAPSQVRKRAP